jgi:hypothetical protein
MTFPPEIPQHGLAADLIRLSCLVWQAGFTAVMGARIGDRRLVLFSLSLILAGLYLYLWLSN